MRQNIKRNISAQQKNLRVLIGLFYPSIGGPQLNNRQLYSRLVERGWTVQISTHMKALEESVSLPAKENIDGIEVFRFQHVSYGYLPFTLKLSYFKKGVIAIHDLLPAPNTFIFLFIYFLKLLGLKRFALIFTLHGFYNQRRLNPATYKDRVENFLDFKVGFPLLNRIADSVRVVSNKEAEMVQRAGVNKPPVYVIGNGLEPDAFDTYMEDKVSEEFKQRIKEIGPYFIQVGRIDRIKNIEAGIQALAYLKKDIAFVIVGPEDAADKDYLRHLRELATRLGVASKVKFLGTIIGSEKYFLLKRALTIIQPSYSESFGSAVLEGMSQGLVPIVSRATGLAELVVDKKSGFHIDLNNIEDLAKKIEYFCNSANSAEILKMSECAKTAAQQYSWETIADSIDKMYAKTMTSVN